MVVLRGNSRPELHGRRGGHWTRSNPGGGDSAAAMHILYDLSA
jgi:hypothetical protein